MFRLRLLPLVALATLCLLVLKSASLLLGGGYTLSGVAPAIAYDPDAFDERAPGDITSALPEMPQTPGGTSTERATPPEAPPELASDQPAKPEPAPQTEANADAAPASSTGGEASRQGPTLAVPQTEMAVLESLSKRRKDLDARERELGLRENLLKAAEKKVGERIGELKTLQAKIDAALKAEDETKAAEIGRLVQMYARMKPKEAAQIFNRLDLQVLSGMAKRMKPSEMAAILAVMDPGAAERLTLELAKQGAKAPAEAAAAELPKISSNKMP